MGCEKSERAGIDRATPPSVNVLLMIIPVGARTRVRLDCVDSLSLVVKPIQLMQLAIGLAVRQFNQSLAQSSEVQPPQGSG